MNLEGALCNGPDVDPNWWTIEDTRFTTTNAVKALWHCGVCPVRRECRQIADATGFPREKGATIAAGRIYTRGSTRGSHAPSTALQLALFYYTVTVARKNDRPTIPV